MSAFVTDLPLFHRKKPRAHPEEDLQSALVQHLRMLAPKTVIWFAVPNGAYKSKRTAARFKAQGLVAGVPDLCFVLADGSAAFLELKSGAGRLSPQQKDFAARCEAMGVPWAVASDIDTALAILRGWEVLPKPLKPGEWKSF